MAALTRGQARWACACAVVFWMVLGGQALDASSEESWRAPLAQDHPLVGRIWDVTAGAFIDRATLVDRLRGSRFVLLGEKHDNPDHHRLQAWLLRSLVEAGRRPAVGFEMFTVADALAIAQHMAAHPGDAVGLAEAVNWQRRGWPPWAMYQPIAEAAMQANLPIVATNLAPDMVRALGQSGAEVPDPTLSIRLELDRPLPTKTRTAMAEDIRQAHCGHATEEQIDVMILVQRARDAQMAERLAAAGQQDGAVLIAGAGHVRRDYGIPTYLASRQPGGSVLSVAFLEVSQELRAPTAYAARFDQQALPFDYVWFTPRVDDQDPCIAFEEQLKRLHKR